MPSGRSTAAGSRVPGTTGTPASRGEPARRELVAERRDRLGARADEDDPAASTARANAARSDEEAVARMDRLGAGR